MFKTILTVVACFRVSLLSKMIDLQVFISVRQCNGIEETASQAHKLLQTSKFSFFRLKKNAMQLFIVKIVEIFMMMAN